MLFGYEHCLEKVVLTDLARVLVQLCVVARQRGRSIQIDKDTTVSRVAVDIVHRCNQLIFRKLARLAVTQLKQVIGYSRMRSYRTVEMTDNSQRLLP